MPIDREIHSDPSTSGRVVEIWSLILRHLFLIIFMSGVGAGLGYLYFLQQPTVYQSNCSLLVQSEAKGQAIPFQGLDNQNTREQPHSILICSPLVIGNALDKDLGDDRKLRDLPYFARMENPERYIISRLGARPEMKNGKENPDVLALTYPA